MLLHEIVAPLSAFLALDSFFFLRCHDLSLVLPGIRVPTFGLEGRFLFLFLR